MSYPSTFRSLQRWLIAPLALALMVAFTASATAQEPTNTPLSISVTASVLETDAPVEVSATAVTEDAEGQPRHHLVVTWTDAEAGQLDDVRFTRHVEADSGAGDLVLAGHGCGADWDEAQAQVTHICTLEFLVIQLDEGEAHQYPIAIYPEVGPLTLEVGTYTVDQTIAWWRPANDQQREEFTVRLVYTVTEGEPTGTFTPEPAASGATLALWGGGNVSTLPQAISFWVTVEGQFIGYVPGAPAVVNQGFMAQFPDGDIPESTAMVVVR